MSARIIRFSLGLLVVWTCAGLAAAQQQLPPGMEKTWTGGPGYKPPVPEEIEKVRQAAPAKPTARPAKARKVLILSRSEGFYHSCIPLADEALAILGEKSGAYEATVAYGMDVFTSQNLARYDAIIFNNTARLKFEDPRQREALLDFVRGGKGFIGIHAASDNFYDFPEASAMIGGQFNGHPWTSGGTWAVKLDEPGHPLNQAFGNAGFLIKDEIYQMKTPPYSRDTLRVLLSLDMDNPVNYEVKTSGIRRDDRDFAISWVREFGKGRVFYCSLGHNHEIFWDPAVLRHYLDGIQYALGDYDVPAEPSAQIKGKYQPAYSPGPALSQDWTELTADAELSAWHTPTGAWTAAATVFLQAGNAKKLDWSSGAGAIVNGPGKTNNIMSKAEHGGLELHIEFMVPEGSNSGIYFQGRYEIQVFDSWGVKEPKYSDAGGIYQRWNDAPGLDKNQRGHEGRAPGVNVSRRPGEWQSFDVIFQAPRFDGRGNKTSNARFVKVVHNGALIHEYVELTGPTRGAWLSGEQALGPIVLQGDHGPVAYRNLRVRALGLESLEVAAHPYSALRRYEIGQSRLALSTIEERIRQASPEALEGIEAMLLRVLADPGASAGGKQFVCRMLRTMGTEESVKHLEALLADPALSHMARFALQEMPHRSAGAALRGALKVVEGDLKIGVITSLGHRGETKAVRALAKIARQGDMETARAALAALGQIGTPNAANVLDRVDVPNRLRAQRIDAYLKCADKILAPGNERTAAKMYTRVLEQDTGVPAMLAAYRGRIQAEPQNAAATIHDLLGSPYKALRQAAAKFTIALLDERGAQDLARQLGGLSAPSQILLLGALEARGALDGLGQIVELADSAGEGVRTAALAALGALGGVEEVELLAKASAAEDASSKVAAAGLARLRGEGVDAALVSLAKSGAPGVRVRAIEALAARDSWIATLVLIDGAGDGDARVRRAAYSALGKLAVQQDIPVIAALLSSTASEAERGGIERALSDLLSRLEDPAAAAPVLVRTLDGASGGAKSNLLALLASAGGGEALGAVQGYASNPDADLRKSAVRALAAWRDAKPADALLGIARQDKDEATRIIALRGYVRLAGLPSERPAAATLEMYQHAMKAAARNEEKGLILSGVAKVPSDRALEFVNRYADGPLKAEAEAARDAIVKSRVGGRGGRGGGGRGRR